MFQIMCKEENSWDDIIDNEVDVLSCLIENECPHRYESIGFCDVLEKAFSVVISVQVLFNDKEKSISSQIIVSKTSVATIKKITTPQLELMSTLLLVQLINNISSILSKNLSIAQEICLTYSAIDLFWIQNVKKQFKQYVKDCVTEIRELTNIESWYHVPRVKNVAILPSRGCLPEKSLYTTYF